MPALQQSDSKEALKRSHLATHGARGDVQLCRSARYAEMARSGFKRTYRVERGQPFHELEPSIGLTKTQTRMPEKSIVARVRL